VSFLRSIANELEAVRHTHEFRNGMIIMAAPILDSGRLLLREYSPSDLDRFTSILGNRNNLRYLPHTEPWPTETIEKWLESSIEHWKSEGYGWWILEHKGTAKAIGWCGLRRLKETNEVEVLY
jgi:ribosomal-protein-alanine N-acetyltransferase